MTKTVLRRWKKIVSATFVVVVVVAAQPLRVKTWKMFLRLKHNKMRHLRGLHRRLGLSGHCGLLSLNELGIVDVAVLVLVVRGLEGN
jgi:hypothetical protein